MTIQRGGSLWRPHVTPTGQLPAHQSHLGNNVQTVTRTSLAHKHPQPVEHIGCGYNNAARPFSAVNGSDGQLKSIVNKQYNTPVGIYSEESIAETLTAQAEVLAGGVLGVNFKKHEKEYNPTNSEVLKFLNEEQSEPREPEPYSPMNFYWTASHCRSPGGRIRTPVSHSATPAPANKTESDDRTGTPTIQQNKEQKSYQQQQNQQPKQQPQQQVIQPKPKAIPYFIQKHMQQAQPDVDLPPKEIAETDSSSGQAVCCSCGTHITGVFCRIKDKNLHVECFKCATCGTSLKNQGYYNFNNKLYCDIHAKAAAMKNPPPGTEGYVPIPLKPTPKLTAGHIANALNAHGYNLQTNGATPALVTGSAPPAGGNVSQGYAPRPFNQGQLSPPSGSQRSPGSGAPSWSQPRPAPIVAQSPYATLPRTGSSQGRHSYSSHSSSNAYSANKSHVTFGPNTYSRPVPIQSAYNNVNIYNRGEGQTQNEIQIQEEPQPKVKHPDHFEDLEVETLNQPPVSTRPFTWPPKESETQDMAPTATPIYIPPPGTQHVLVKEHQEDVMRKQEEEIQRQQIVKEEHRQVQRQEQQQKTVQTQQKTQEYYEQQQLSQQESRQQQQQEQQQWQVRSAPQLNSHYHVEVESGSDSYTSTSTTTTTTSEEYNRMYQAQLQAYQMQQMYDQSGSEYDYHMEIDQHNVRQEQDHCYSMSSDIHSIQSGRRSVQECADNLQSTLSMYKLIDMVREVTPSPTPMNKPRRVEFLDSEETLEQKSKKEETLTVNETAQQTTEKNVTEEKEQSKPGEEERRQSVVEEIIVPQKVSSVGSSEDTGRRIIITPIEESTERLFPPTPEIKVIFPPPLILPPSNIPNPVPKEWINPMVKALTIAPDKPIELHPGLDEYLSDIQEEQSAADLTAETEQTTSSTQPAEYYCSTVECKSSSKIPGDTSKLTCIESCQNVCSGTCSERAAEAPCTTCPMSKGNICCKKNQSQNETIQQSILKEEPPKGSKISKTLTSVPEYKFQFAPAAGEYIPLPEETKPYMPPPIDMTPYTKEDFRPKSPMLSALITAPDEPYKRFESDVCSQLLDMPTVSEKLTLSDALITAPERAYSPLSTDNILKLGLDQPPTKPEYIHLSLEEQKAETEQKVFEKRQESMDRKISAFVSLGPAGFKPPPPGAIQVLPHPLPTPSSGVTTPKQQSSASHDTRQVIFPPTPEQLIQDDLFKTKQTATAAAATANSTFNTTSMQSAIASSASFASNQTTSSINSTTNIDTKSAADTGVGGKSGGSFSATSAPKRGRGILNKAVGPGSRIPQCGACQTHIRGPFITALGRIWCPDHFMCVNGSCRRPLQDIGFVEEKGDLYCEFCFEKYLAPTCSKCNGKIKGDCLNAIGKHFHPECFTCAYCGKLFGNTPFFLEDGEPYCEADWNELFTTKCFACGFPVEAGDRWVEALNHNYHSQCFNCTMCKKNLEGQSFFNKGGRPFCKNHAR
ncbi:PDZ and LIM domain protein Zasp-like isoform X7 [Condylostylus longicornis]|uniref:PDZ and LIM domain protein Zasp-like isoform X7 n=1 Tax=Condylostylus longicornis TaxID=2530218 RepID=UPI00244DCAE1|nr:PDZ and LIM domain protein Zasp-like isoform X7 [Condylostylus longicornis]